MYSGSWKTCTYAEDKEDDLIILNQLRGDKTIFIEDNGCEILDSNYIKDKKNKISYRKLWSYLPQEVINTLYKTLMREYYDEKVMMMKVPRPRDNAVQLSQLARQKLVERGLEQKESGKWGYPTAQSRKLDFKEYGRNNRVFRPRLEQENCVCLTKKGKICGKKCMSNGYALNKPFAFVEGILTGPVYSLHGWRETMEPEHNYRHQQWGAQRWPEIDPSVEEGRAAPLRCCGTHKRMLDKMSPKQLKTEIAKIMLAQGYVEKHGIWCVAPDVRIPSFPRKPFVENPGKPVNYKQVRVL